MLVDALRQATQGFRDLAEASATVGGQAVTLTIRVEQGDLADRLERQLEDRLLTTLRKRLQ